MTTKNARIVFYAPGALEAQIRAEAARTGAPLGEVIRRALHKMEIRDADFTRLEEDITAAEAAVAATTSADVKELRARATELAQRPVLVLTSTGKELA
jgi:hypothetical protein